MVIVEVIADTPYHLIVTPYSRSQDPLDPVRYLVETGSADGVIISRTQPNDPRARYMLERGIPFATHGRTDMGLVHPYHDFDNYAFAGEAVRHLAGMGRRRLALVTPPVGLTYYGHTVNGFADALSEIGASEVPFNTISIDHTIEQIRMRTAQLMRRQNRPDGIVSSAGAPSSSAISKLTDTSLNVSSDAAYSSTYAATPSASTCGSTSGRNPAPAVAAWFTTRSAYVNSSPAIFQALTSRTTLPWRPSRSTAASRTSYTPGSSETESRYESDAFVRPSSGSSLDFSLREATTFP